MPKKREFSMKSLALTFTSKMWIRLFSKDFKKYIYNFISLHISVYMIFWLYLYWNQFIVKLAWEPSAAQVTKSVSSHYPHLNEFTGKLKRTTKLKILKPSIEHYRRSPEFPKQNWRQISPVVSELWSEKQTHR